MAQSTVLSAGTTAGTSSDIVVAAGSTVTVGIFPAAGGTLRSSVAFHVLADTPGSDRVVAKLSSACQATQLSGPGTYRVRRPAYTGTAFGVYLET
jgi:hypothetical protein